MISKQRILTTVLILSFSKVFAYEADYKLDGRFLIEVTSNQSEKRNLEIWDIFLQRGMIDGKQHFIDFDLVSIVLGQSKENEYRIRSIDMLYNRSDEGKLKFYEGKFVAEWGIAEKWTVRINFNKDGTLKSISGEKANVYAPRNIKTFSLVKSVMRFNIDEINNFPLKKYIYKKNSP